MVFSSFLRPRWLAGFLRSTVDGVFWMSPDLETDIFLEEILADEPGDNDPGEPLIEI